MQTGCHLSPLYFITYLLHLRRSMRGGRSSCLRPSLAAAHLHQFCNNFKDPGVQPYASGALFQTLRDTIDAIFCELPPPSPSGWRASQSQAAVAPVSMRTFNNASQASPLSPELSSQPAGFATHLSLAKCVGGHCLAWHTPHLWRRIFKKSGKLGAESNWTFTHIFLF